MNISMIDNIRLYQWIMLDPLDGDVIKHHPDFVNYAVGLRLRGKVFGHPDFEDGSWVTTSEVVAVGPLPREVQTNRHVYILGAPAHLGVPKSKN